jgi:hypothetical protein
LRGRKKNVKKVGTHQKPKETQDKETQDEEKKHKETQDKAYLKEQLSFFILFYLTAK